MDYTVTIRDINNNLVWEGLVDDSSYRNKEVMGDNKLFLNLSADRPIQVPLFAWTMFKGERYFLWKPGNFTKKNTENHEYRLEMDTYLIYLKSQKYEFFTSTQANDIEITFSLSATPKRFLDLAVANMNMKDADGGWTAGEFITADEANLDFDDMTIWDALNMIAERFSVEWEVEGKRIHIRKVEKLPENPIPLEYGRGGGILGGGTYSGKNGSSDGISRTNGSGRIGVLRIKTDNRNIDASAYGFNTLRMPREYILDYGDVRYITDKTGTKLRRYEMEGNHPILPEATLDLTHIYPMREGVVDLTDIEEVEVDTEEGKVTKEYYVFTDGSIPGDLDYTSYLIPGTTMIVVFQSGSLSGLEFEVEYDHNEKKFTLIPNTGDGVTYPNEFMKPGIGNKYVVLNIMLPAKYIEEAEAKILEKAAEYLYDNEGDRFIYAFDLDPIYAKNNWGSISGYLDLGYFVRLTEPQYLAEPVDIRITGLKEYVNEPYSPRITLSNNVRGQSIGADIRQVQNLNQTVRRTGKGIARLTEVRWRDLTELFDYLHYLMHLGFTEGIKPVAINTMMAYFGAEMLQYRWVDSKEDPHEVDMYYKVDNDNQTFMVDGGIIQHMTLGIDVMKPDHGANEYKFWDIAPLPPTYIGDRGFLWLYIRVQKDGTQGVFLFSETEIEPESVPGYYHLLCGTLNSPFEGTRNFFTWYGFSVITPGQIRVPKVASIDGTQYFDFLNKAFHIGNEETFIDYNSEQDGRLRFKGVIVQSPSGETDVLEVDRGDYNAGVQYYPGDKVKYSNGNIYKNAQQSKGIAPTNTSYWRLLVTKGDTGYSGSDGRDGQDGKDAIYYEYIYYASDSEYPPSRPTSSPNYDGYIPSGWSSRPDIGVREYLYTSQRKKDGSWGSWETPVLFSKRGRNGRIFSYTGAYDRYKGYFGDAEIAQVVYNEADNAYYYTAFNAGHFSGIQPPNTQYWVVYEANFESVATGLLFAQQALIAGFNFYNNKIESVQSINGMPKIGLYGDTGEVIFQSEGNNGVPSKMVLNEGRLSWHTRNTNEEIMSIEVTDGGQSGIPAAYITINNFPPDSKSLPAGTVYVDSDGFLKVRLV